MPKLNTIRERPMWHDKPAAFGRMGADHSALYNSRRWRVFSERFKCDNPLCCVDGCNQPAAYTDHITPIAEGGAIWDRANLQALCVHHNASKTGGQRHRKTVGGGVNP